VNPLLAVLLTLFFSLSGPAMGGCSDFGRSSIAAKTGAPVKNLTEQAADLVPLNGGRNRVTLRSPSQQMEVDLAGKSHGGVPTPHTKVSPLNPRAPNQPAFNTKNSPVVIGVRCRILTFSHCIIGVIIGVRCRILTFNLIT